MPPFHLIEDGVVTNTVLFESLPPSDAFPGLTVIEATEGGPGWRWDGTAFSPPLSEPPPVPAAITRLQLILGMTDAGLITPAEGVAAAAGNAIPSVVESVFASLPAAQATSARIRWSAMTEVERLNPLVAAVASAAGKTDAEMDQFFRDWSLL